MRIDRRVAVAGPAQEEIKKQLVTKALEQAAASYVEPAKRLGLHPNNLHRLAKTLKLK